MHIRDKTFLILLTIQKILPIVLLSFLNINLLLLFTIIIFMTLLTSIINLKKTSSIKRILGLSSLNNNSWFMISFFLSIKIFFLFLLFYSLSLIVLLKYLIKIKNYKIKMLIRFWLIILLVSNIGGIPPFSLFWIKSIILKFPSAARSWAQTVLFSALTSV